MFTKILAAMAAVAFAIGGAILLVPQDVDACCGGGPPNVNASADVTELWPPNHKFDQVVLTATSDGIATDNWFITEVVVVDYVTAGEDCSGAGGKKHDPDFQIGDDGQTLMLRAERCGNSGGREYQVYLNIEGQAYGYVSVIVPHDMSES
jgi:hypothetical protein